MMNTRQVIVKGQEDKGPQIFSVLKSGDRFFIIPTDETDDLAGPPDKEHLALGDAYLLENGVWGVQIAHEGEGV